MIHGNIATGGGMQKIRKNEFVVDGLYAFCGVFVITTLMMHAVSGMQAQRPGIPNGWDNYTVAINEPDTKTPSASNRTAETQSEASLGSSENNNQTSESTVADSASHNLDTQASTNTTKVATKTESKPSTDHNKASKSKIVALVRSQLAKLQSVL